MGGQQSSSPEGVPAKGYDALEVISQDDPTWSEIDELIKARQRKYISHYKNQDLKMKRLWRIRPQPGFRDIQERVEGLGPPMQLFHGTDVQSAQRIVEAGFQLPKEPGMFGKGVYFARCPLKSEMYSKGAGIKAAGFAVSSMFRRVVRGKEEPSFASRVMLLCDVYLGNSKAERCLANVWCGCYADVSAPEEIKPTCLDWFFCPHQCCYHGCRGGFDSVYAPGGEKTCMNTVKVTEYVVYDPEQANPLYLIEFFTERTESGDVVGGAVRAKQDKRPSRSRSADKKGIELRS